MRLAVVLFAVAAGLFLTSIIDLFGGWAAASGAVCLIMASVICAMALESNEPTPVPLRDDAYSSS